MATVDVVDGPGAAPFGHAVFTLYVQVFGAQDEQRWRDEVWERHRNRPEYRLATAVDQGDIVGFALGYTGFPGQYWTDLMSAALGGAADRWIGGHFEFVVLAVDASRRGQGLGGRLHDQLLSGVRNETAMLCTSTDPTNPALPLYRSRGWSIIGRINTNVQIMGVPHPGTPMRSRGLAGQGQSWRSLRSRRYSSHVDSVRNGPA